MTTSAELSLWAWPVAPFLCVRFWAAVVGRRPSALLQGALTLGVLAVAVGLPRTPGAGALQLVQLALMVGGAAWLDRRTGGSGGLYVGALSVIAGLPFVALQAFELLRIGGLRTMVTGLPELDLLAACVLAVLVPVAARGSRTTPLWRGWTPTRWERRALALCCSTLVLVGLWPLLVRLPVIPWLQGFLRDLGQLLLSRETPLNAVWFPAVRSLTWAPTVAASLGLGLWLSGGGRRPPRRSDLVWIGLPAAWLLGGTLIDRLGYHGLL